jgi:uncharacterized protein (TIRG00374 family)
MTETKEDISRLSKPLRILFPVFIGLAVTGYLFYRNYNSNSFENFSWTIKTAQWLMLGVLMIIIRDLAYMVRIKELTNNELTWKKSFEVIILWEFCSAIMPAILGGGFAFAIAIINKEKIKLGKSISVVLFSSFLDGLFFAIFAPLIYFTLGSEKLFSSLSTFSNQQMSYGQTLEITFWTIYFIVLFYKLLIAYALFFNARAVKKILLKIFSFSLLKKWRPEILEVATDMVIASKELKNVKLWYWIKTFAATVVSWSARFILINCIIKAFSTVPFDHYLLYGRQLVIGILMIGSPTPGGAGVAELMFSNFLGEFIDNKSLTILLTIIWRMMSYYPYIIVGAIVLPRWIKRVWKD